MRQILSIGVLVVVYLGAAFLLTDYDWWSKIAPAMLAVLAAWLVCRTVSKIALVVALFILAVVFPLSILIFSLAATESIYENTRLLISKLSIHDMLFMFAPVVVGYVVAIAFSYVNPSARQSG